VALIVEDGTGKTNSESYASVADADTYFTARRGDTTWAAASTANKEKALRNATDYIEEKYNARFIGRKATKDQALAFPRAYIESYDGYAIESDEIPEKLKRATMELAVRALSEDLLPDLANPGEIASETNQVGSLRQSVTYIGGKGNIKSYRSATMLLREYLMGETFERS
tara:strand:+ start:265 stop:774 length:510 start_codon:yes stop_codon:yes gene_type:complete